LKPAGRFPAGFAGLDTVLENPFSRNGSEPRNQSESGDRSFHENPDDPVDPVQKIFFVFFRLFRGYIFLTASMPKVMN